VPPTYGSLAVIRESPMTQVMLPHSTTCQRSWEVNRGLRLKQSWFLVAQWTDVRRVGRFASNKSHSRVLSNGSGWRGTTGRLRMRGARGREFRVGRCLPPPPVGDDCHWPGRTHACALRQGEASRILKDLCAVRWPSGRRRRFAKPLYGLKPVSRVRIPSSPNHHTHLTARPSRPTRLIRLTRPVSPIALRRHGDHARCRQARSTRLRRWPPAAHQ
jgi:hypothetical protein